MTTTSSTAASTTFIDLATFSELEGFIYGGPQAITWNVASIQKSNWFSFIPISLRHCSGVPDFGQRNVAASVNRSGDYVLSVWFRALIPPIGLVSKQGGRPGASIRWVRHLMHNLFEKIQITFNELVVEEFDNYWLDNEYIFRIPGSKRMGYKNMILDISPFTVPVAVGTPLGTGYGNLILKFWFGEDSGLALPVAALPFNDIKINYCIRRWQELVCINPGNGSATAYTIADVKIYDGDTATTSDPRLMDPQTFAHYSVVHNDERVKMGDAPRDMLIRQVQESQLAPFKDVTSRNGFDIRLSHAIISFFFAAENTSLFDIGKGQYGREMSNYTTLSETAANPEPGADPISYAQLIYENTVRVAMGADYYTLTLPYLLSDAVPGVDDPLDTGYHMYTYALHPWFPTKPSGSTNYSKLANVSILYDMSPAANNAAQGLTESGAAYDFPGLVNDEPISYPQKWRHVFVAQNWNIARVANGSLGHPTL